MDFIAARWRRCVPISDSGLGCGAPRSRTAILAATIALMACGGRDDGPTASPPPPAEPTWDLAARGVPPFVTSQYVDLARIHRISRFRSGIGHHAGDGTESCRSMKHYFEPRGTEWSTVQVFSPIVGTVAFLDSESRGAKVTIRSTQFPAFLFEIFHVRLAAPLTIGTALTAGQLLGTHWGTETHSDVAVVVNTPEGRRLVSWFETLTEERWQDYVRRGVATRSAFTITKAERDANPLTCTGELPFPCPGTLPNWVVLN